MAVCWSCSEAEYHNYDDLYGIRCPRCGQKEKDDPRKRTKIVVTEAPKAPVKRATRSKA